MPTFAIGILLSLLAAGAWGSASVIFKVGVKKTDAFVATYIRGLVAVPLLIILGLLINGTETFTKLFLYPNNIWLVLGGISIAIGDFFSLFALRKIDVSISQPIAAIYPIFTTLTLLIAKIENINWFIMAGTLLITFGVMLISFFSQRDETIRLKNSNNKENEESKAVKKILPLGIALSIIAAVFWGFAIVFNRLILEDESIDVLPLMGIRNGIMVLIFALIVLIRPLINKEKYKSKIFAPRKEALFFMGGGAISWCIGGVSFFSAVKLIGAGFSTPISSISPFVVMLLGGLFLKEKITYPQMIGVAIIVAGSIILSLPELLHLKGIEFLASAKEIIPWYENHNYFGNFF